jgi:hypothetical protein
MRFFIIASLIASLVPQTANAYVWAPPAAYSTQCSVPVKIIDYWLVDRACTGSNERAHGRRVEACALRTGKRWSLVLPKVDNYNISQADQDELRRHECAHVNGWAGDHPGAL